MDRGRAAAALLALAASIACATAAPTSSDQTALEISEGPSNGCYYNFQHYGEGDRIMTNEPCLNCTCHNRMLMCYLRVCPFTKPIGQDCTIEKRADQCCPIVTCPDVPVDLLTSTSTSSPAEYGATGLGKLDKYGCSINGKYFPEGSKVPPSPNKPCEHCYCIRNMTTCVMQECTLHVDGCTPIYHKDVCCPVRYSCDHPEDEIPLLDDMTTTIRPTPGFLLTTTTMQPVTQSSQNCVHDDEIVPDGALIKTEKACEHCYCMKGDIVCVVQECGTPMENEGKNCTSLPPRQGQCCPDTYICEGDESSTEETTQMQEITTAPPRRFGVEDGGYRSEPDETYTEIPTLGTEEEGSGEELLSTVSVTEKSTDKTTGIKEISTAYDLPYEISTEGKQITNIPLSDSNRDKDQITTELIFKIDEEQQVTTTASDLATNVNEDDHFTSENYEKFTTEIPELQDVVTAKVEKTTKAEDKLDEATLKEDDLVPEKEHKTPLGNEYASTTLATSDKTKTINSLESTTLSFIEKVHQEITTPETEIQTIIDDISSDIYTTTPKEKLDVLETTSINPIENEIHELDLPIYSPGRIPGEGDCLLNSITYKNNTIVPSTNTCHINCRCISSIIKCEPIVCSAPPEYMNDCQSVYDTPESCCPTYVCSTKETMPPESHNQMSESESAKPVLASECNSPHCESSENIFTPSGCAGNECEPKDKAPSPDTEIFCDGEKCIVKTPLETHPELHHDAPECSAENGCTKPVDNQIVNDCTDNCKTEPALECIGSDCTQEFPKVTRPEEVVTTSYEYPTNEQTEKSVTTGKLETLQPAGLDTETSTLAVNIDSKPIEEYITVPIESSTDISKIETLQTKSPQTQDVTSSHEISDTPALSEHTTLIEEVQTEPNEISLIDSDVTKQQPSSTSEQTATESYDTNKDVYQSTTSGQNTRVDEHVATESQTVTAGSYETKPGEPVMDEVGVTYSSEFNKDTTLTSNQDQLNADVTKLYSYSIQDTTESLLKETTISQEPTTFEAMKEDALKPATSGSTISDLAITESIESGTLAYPAATEGEQKLITQSEKYTTPSSLEFDGKDKTTELIPTRTVTSENVPTSTESGEYKPVTDNIYDLSTIKNIQSDTENDLTSLPEIHTELPTTEATKITESKLHTTEVPDVTKKIDKDITEIFEDKTETSHDKLAEVTTEAVTTDTKNINEKEDAHVTTEAVTTDTKNINEKEDAHVDSVTNTVSVDREYNTITEVVPTEKIVGGDETVTETSKDIQETHTNLPTTNINLSESDKQETESSTKSRTESGYDQTTSPAIYEYDTTVISVKEVPIRITTGKEPDVISEITTEIVENVQDTNELSTTPYAQEDVPSKQNIQHNYYTTEESYKISSEPPIDKDLSSIITTVSPVQEEDIKTPHLQEDISSTENISFETSSKNYEQRVPVEVTTESYQEATTHILSVTDTMLPTDSAEKVYPSENIKPGSELPRTEATIKYEDKTTQSEVKDNVGYDDTFGISTESNTYGTEPNTEKIVSDTLASEVSHIGDDSTRITSEVITEVPSKEETGHEKDTTYLEPATVSEKADTTVAPKTDTTSIQNIMPAFTTVSSITGFTNEFEIETQYISTTPKAIDNSVEITTVKKVTEDTEVEQHTETGSGEEDTVTSSPSSEGHDFDSKQELTTSVAIVTSLATDTPTEETTATEIQKRTTTEAFEVTTQSNINASKETYPHTDVESATAAISTESVPSFNENILPTTENEGLETEPDKENAIKESTEPKPEHDNQQSETPLEASTPISIYEEISTPHSVLSLVTDKSEKEPEKTDMATLMPIQEQHKLTTESLFVDKDSTEKLETKTPETLTTFHHEPQEYDEKVTPSEEKQYSTDLNKYPEVITEYIAQKTTIGPILSEDNEIPHPVVTVETQTKLPDSTYEIPSVTKESTISHDFSETTTQKVLEKETETSLEDATKLTMHYGDKHETTTQLLLETEPQKQLTTTEILPDIRKYETTLAVEVGTDDLVTKSPSVYPTKETADILEQTEKVPSVLTYTDITNEETTSLSPDTFIVKDTESQSTEQSTTSKDTVTTIRPKDVTEKETEIDDLSRGTTSGPAVTSVLIDEQTEKDILREPTRDVLEATTYVPIDKHEGIDITSATKESFAYTSESTTLKSIEEEKDEKEEYPNITQQTTQEENLYQPTTSRLPERESESEIQLIDTTLDTSFTTLGVPSSTPIYKTPETTDTAQKSTEPAVEYSETTPYHIELQEHTHQSIDELSSKLPPEGESTTEQYISEHPDRGDIPHRDYDVNVTTHDEDENISTLKEDNPSTTPKTIHDEIPTETDRTTQQSASELPKEDEKYTVLPIETQKPVITPETEAQTEKYIPTEFESHKPDISTDGISSIEDLTKVTVSPVFTEPSKESTVHAEELDKPEEKPVETTDVTKPELNEPSDDLPSPDFPPSAAGGYGQEPDYGDSEDQAFGPGTCRYGGKVYVSAQQIPRDDPCDFCFCFRSDIICLQQSCPPPIHGCHEEPIQGFCCPRYECPVSMATTLNVTTTTTTTTTTLPPHFLPHAYKGAAQRKGCQIKGHSYKVGEVVRASSGPCLHCTCGGDGQMKCDPKACTPEPMLRQMIAAAVSAKRRR